MIDAFLTTIHPKKMVDFASNLRASCQFPIRIIASSPIKDPPAVEGVTWIFNDGTPMKAQEAALRYCTAEYVLNVVDDLVYEPGAVEELFRAAYGKQKVMPSPHYHECGNYCEAYHRPGFFAGCSGNPPLCPANGIYRRQDLVDILPYDPQFIYDYGLADLTSILMCRGWKTVMVPKAVNHLGITSPHYTNSLWQDRGHQDFNRFKEKWAPQGILDPRLNQTV